MGTKILIGVFGVALVVAAVGVAYPELLFNNAPVQDMPVRTSTPPVAAKTGCGSDGDCCCASKGKVCGCNGEEAPKVEVKASCCGGAAPAKVVVGGSCCGGPAGTPATATAAAIGLALSPQGSLTSAAALTK